MISHQHKTIFVHIPKCGGTSIDTAFLTDLNLDWSTREALLLRPNNNHLLGPPRLAHLLISEYLKFNYIDEVQFARYYKFALVRSPFSRVISIYNYLNQSFDLNHFVEKWLRKQFDLVEEYSKDGHHYEGKYHFVRPQVDFLCDSNGEFLVDDVFRLEEINEHYMEIRAKSGLKSDLPHVNVSKNRRAGIKDLSANNIKTILKLYEKDFVALGYDKSIIH